MSDLVFGKYEIQHRIAIGGMGEVFYAMQRGVSGFERPVILKSLLPDLAQQQDLVNQFLDEARVAATLNHPNVVSIFEVGLWNGTFYIAMEYIRGRNLAQLVRRALEQQVRLPPAVSARIIREAALGLDHAHVATDSSGHKLNIVHRDISPQNIMVREDGVAKVVDFGIASASNRSTRTATGTLKGKLAYMAPEQILLQPLTAAVDQFALGIVFWELLVCRRLFKADNDVGLIKAVLESEIPRADGVMSDVPRPLADVVARMLNRDPAQRFPSLHDVADALEGLAVTPTQSHSPGAFMKRLGTDDLNVQVRPPSQSGENFVISLNDGKATPEHVEIDLQTATGVKPASSATKKRRGPIVAAIVIGLGLAGGAVVLATLPPKPTPETTPQPTTTVTPAPVVVNPSPEVDSGAPIAVAIAEASLTLETTPAGAQLRFDGKPLGPSPQTLKVSPNTPHYLQAELAGYERAEGEVTLQPGEGRAIRLALKQRVGKTRPPPPPVGAAPAKGAPGYLTVATTPWTKVTIDGELMGSTPINKIRLEPGPHMVQFINEGEGINTQRTVTIASGENHKLQLKLP